MADLKKVIAARVAGEFKDGYVVNLGIGLPSLAADFVPEGVDISLQSENGLVGLGPCSDESNGNPDLVNASGEKVTVIPGASFFDSVLSFSIIRGRHVDITVLGAMEVDEKGNLANWCIPGKFVPGMGGAMDLVVGAKKVIIAMQHTNKGQPKLLKKCSLPLTASGVVNMIITEMGVIEIDGKGFLLTEINPDYTIEQIKQATAADLRIASNLKSMKN